ncbi:MAG: lipid-A-disaccharide synthase [Opitutaceae bacterium]|nr:lipid-A-disaccharide synthase [Opitutaceae bacterium]
MPETPQLPFSLPPPAGGRVDVLIVAGEHSGDEHAARLVCELRARQPELQICALGGPKLAAAGAQLLWDLTAFSVVGFVEVLRHFGFYRTLFGATLAWIGRHRPRAVCFVDYPGFNLRLARALHARGLTAKGGGKIRALYYISPQIWAWKAGRRFEMARHLDALAVIFPFEVKSYADTPLPVEFVGHPFVAGDYRSPVRHDPAGPVLLLPGSRRQAVARIFPALLAGYGWYRQQGGDRGAVVIHPSEEVAAVLRSELTRWPHLAGKIDLHEVIDGRARADNVTAAASGRWGGSLRVDDKQGGAGPPGPPDQNGRPGGPPLSHGVAASAVLTSSGTMSMHCALAGIPGAIAYRTSPLTYAFGCWLVKVPYIGIANLLLDEPMYPEFIQGAATPANLGRELTACLDDPARRRRCEEQARRLRARLHQPGSGTAADWLVRQLA